MMVNIIVHIVIISLAFLIGNEGLRDVMGYFYLFQLGWFTHLINKNNTEKLLKQFLQPSYLIVAYVCLNFGFGCLSLNGKFGILQDMIDIYYTAKYFVFVNVFFIFCNFLVFETGNYIRKKHDTVKIIPSMYPFKISNLTFFFACFLFFIFSVIDLDLSFIGGFGSFSYIPKIVSIIIILLSLSYSKNKLRVLYYFLILLIFSAASYDSKREIIFIMLLIIYVENAYNPIKFTINIKSIVIGLFSFLIFAFFILVSSINRGYGSYNADGVIEAVKYIPDYMESEIFKDAIAENFEINVVYGNALNSADMYLSGKQETLYGETFLKALFVPLPKDLLGYKPDSMIQLYSPVVYTDRDHYITFPVLIYSELLWNFWVFSIFGLIIIVSLLDKFFYRNYISLKKNEITFKVILGMVLYTIFMQFIRGSGLDLLVLYLLISIPFIIFFLKLNKIKTK